MSNVLVLTGGPDYAHDFVGSSQAIADVLAVDGHSVTVIDHPDLVADALGPDVDVLVVNALRWQMAHERYDHLRERWGYTTSAATRDAITAFVSGGGGLIGCHTASICFDDWPEWGRILGGSWNWESSGHPVVGPVSALVATIGAIEHPVMHGVVALELHDEVYGALDLQPGIEVLMTARRYPDDDEQPVVWAWSYGAGRVVYDVFGHDAASVNDPRHARVLRNSVGWVARLRTGGGCC